MENPNHVTSNVKFYPAKGEWLNFILLKENGYYHSRNDIRQKSLASSM